MQLRTSAFTCPEDRDQSVDCWLVSNYSVEIRFAHKRGFERFRTRVRFDSPPVSPGTQIRPGQRILTAANDLVKKASKKILAKTTAIWQVDRLRLSETSKDNGTYCTFELGRLERVVVFRTLRVAKSFRKRIIDYSKGRRSHE